MATVKEIADKLIGSTSYGEQPNGLSASARVRERARANYGKGRSMSMFTRAHNEPLPDRSVFSIERHYRALAALDENTEGMKETNRAAHQAAREDRENNRERIDDLRERREQGFDEEYSAPDAHMPQSPESAELPEAEQRSVGKAGRNEAGARFTGVEEANRDYAARRGLAVPRVS